MENKYTIQNIFQKYGPEYIKHHKLSKEQWKVYNAIIALCVNLMPESVGSKKNLAIF